MEPEGWKNEKNVSGLLRPKPLLPYMKRLPLKRVVSLTNVSGTDFLPIRIEFNTSGNHFLPPGAMDHVFATYNLSGIEESIRKLGEGGKILVHFNADLSGWVEIDRAEYVAEVTESEPPTGKP